MAEPNVLLLDEPTNDLDIDTCELESLLTAGSAPWSYLARPVPGRADRDTTWALFGDGNLTNLPEDQQPDARATQAAAEQRHSGNMDLGGGAGGAGGAGSAGGVDGAGAGSGSDTAAAPALSAQEDRALAKELGALERKMSKLDSTIGDLNNRLADAAAPADGQVDTALLAGLDRQLTAARDEHEELEMSWLEIAEQREAGHGR